MQTDRFETFFDAVLAIIITVLVLKLGQPAEATWNSVIVLNSSFITYFICFLTIFVIWYDNHNLFHIVETIDNKVLSIYACLMFVISLIPYFAKWVALNPNSIPAETCFGLIFLTVDVFYILALHAVYRANPYNKKLKESNFVGIDKFIPIIVMLVGFILAYSGFPSGIFLCCLISVILWILIARFQRTDFEDSGRFEALIDAIIAIVVTIIVLEIPMASGGSWDAIFKVRLEFIIYAVSFLVCFNYWNYNNNLFSIVNKIDYKVIWSIGMSLFVLSLIPYFTVFVAENFNSFVPHAVYGIDFLIVTILSIISSNALKNVDKANIALQLVLDNNKIYVARIACVAIGFVVGYFIYPPAIMISCLISIVLVWIIHYLK